MCDYEVSSVLIPISHGQKSLNLFNRNFPLQVRAAFIHVIGDLFQSVGVLIAAYVIRYKVCRKIIHIKQYFVAIYNVDF